VAKNQMLINYVPGEECRVAMVSGGMLEELHEERANNVSHVGDIYVGRVVNVESSIQAAFIDFGLEHNGFLHISDLHPQYFPGDSDDRVERVGKKTPRRERPPIQQALKKGQEITVQVLKEGIGTKGPTLTSYLSIPGRYLVMMPDMDRVGVSRKVEDEEQRRKMKEALSHLTLPEGFGFILRTAGLDRTKTDLKRDLAYLTRLWKDMERRRKAGKKPRLLYAESDLLMRSLRDLLTSDIDEVVIDDPGALKRAARFIKIVSPRAGIKLLHYDRPLPLFHAFGIEEQIERIHSREVPLPSGGSLVIDETEAVVAIDVNSGKMRRHGDAETTAYKTNCEAVEEICRQLRLRDLGGLVINDLIDMRSRSNRRDIENRLKNALKRDRARTKPLPISQFGIVEMTRQRMKGSHRSAHFTTCPTCQGRGHVQRPDSVASDSMRSLAHLLHYDRVRNVEMVVSARVASELLSTKRLRLGRLEQSSGKRVEVRVSDTMPVDRVTFYAYDERGADIEIERLRRPEAPTDLSQWSDKAAAEDWSVDPESERHAEASSLAEASVAAEEIDEDVVDAIAIDEDAEDETRGKKRRRRRRGGRGRRRKAAADTEDSPERKGDREAEPSAEKAEATAEAPGRRSDEESSSDEEQTGGRKRRRRRRGGRGRRRKGRSEDAGEKTESKGDAQAGSKADDQSDADEDLRDRTDELIQKEGGEQPALRGDSWDLEPEAVAPARPKRSGRSGERAPDATPGDNGEETSASKKPAGKRSRSSSKRGRSSEPEDAGAEEAPEIPTTAADASGGPRGDSWDLEPAEPAPPPKKDEAEAQEPSRPTRKRSSRKKSASKAKTGSDTDSGDEKASSKPASKKKRSTRKKKTAAAAKGEEPAEAAAKKKRSTRKKKSSRSSKKKGDESSPEVVVEAGSETETV